MSFTSQNFNNTVQIFSSIGVRVYVIQQAPFQAYNSMTGFYKKLADQGQLTDAKVRSLSVQRTKYIEQQKAFVGYFSKLNNSRDVSVIYIDDIVCDELICPIGTSRLPYYNDDFHMSWVGSRRLKDKLNKYITL